MKIAMVLDKKGNQPKSSDHIILADRNELSLLITVFEEYCKNNPRKMIAKRLLKQFDESLMIY